MKKILILITLVIILLIGQALALEYGSVETNHNWKTVTFENTFTETPLVFAQTNTDNSNEPTIVRLKEITPTSFKIKLQGTYTKEEISWLAIEEHQTDTSIAAKWNFKQRIPFDWLELSSDTIISPTTPHGLVQIQTYRGRHPVHVDIQELTTNSVTGRMEEPPNYDNWHTRETIAGIGFTEFENAVYDYIEVDDSWQQIQFSQTFNEKPSLLAAIATENEDDMVTVAIRNLDENGFEIKLKEYSVDDGTHGTEQVSYLALGEFFEPECTQDNQCQGEQTCEQYVCVDPTCADCQYIFNHVCYDYECCQNSDCQEHYTCEDNFCDFNPECEDNNDCQEHHSCIDYTCEYDPECENDNDCNQDYSCVNYICEFNPECTQDTDCDEHYTCEQNSCEFNPECENDNDCPENNICENNYCTYIEPETIDIAVIRTSSTGVDPIINTLDDHYNVDEFQSVHEVTNDYELLIYPGSADGVYDVIYDSSINTAIQNYIDNGGNFLGICGGAILGTEKLYFNYNGYNIPITMSGLLDVKSYEYNDWVNYYIGNSVELELEVEQETELFPGMDTGDTLTMTYAAGPTFTTNTEDIVLTYNQDLNPNLNGYQISGKAAVVKGTYGQGKVLLSSPHPEYNHPEILLDYVEWTIS